MDDLTIVRERAKAHQEEIEATRTYYTPQRLARLLSVSVSTVKAIPFEELPYKEVGSGAKHKHRRYSPEAVAAYEAEAMPKNARKSAA